MLLFDVRHSLHRCKLVYVMFRNREGMKALGFFVSATLALDTQHSRNLRVGEVVSHIQFTMLPDVARYSVIVHIRRDRRDVKLRRQPGLSTCDVWTGSLTFASRGC